MTNSLIYSSTSSGSELAENQFTNSPVNTIGLIAGKGKLPLLFVQEAKKKFEISAIGFKGITEPRLAKIVDSFHWANLDRWEEIGNLLQKEKVKRVVLLGTIKHSYIFENWRFDQKTKELWNNLKNKKAITLLKAATKILAEKGIKVISPAIFLKPFLASRGILTKSVPTEKEWDDIRFGYQLAKTLARLDIGQTLVVKDKAVLAVEAMEGTDNCIARAGRINKNGLIVVKVARPKQDLRFDPPVVGIETLRILEKVKARVLACEAGKTLLLDKENFLKKAEKINLSVVAL